ncbi:MAG: alanine racemase [Deltaproteobacteria bacterium]|nr:alanine racemase [Deltaproteobacteria bacterium]
MSNQSPSEVLQPPTEKMGQAATWVRIDHAALRHNFDVSFQCQNDARILAMVKADAYGHGAAEICQTLEDHPALAGFGVAIVDEGIELRQAGIKKDIVVHAGACWLHRIQELITHHLQPVVSSLLELEMLFAHPAVQALQSPLKIHLALDTGMAREGLCVLNDDENVKHANDASFLSEVLEPIFSLLSSGTQLELASVFTHFANADQAQHAQNERQRRRFAAVLSWMHNQNVLPNVVHSDNSAALLEAGFSEAGFSEATQLLVDTNRADTTKLNDDGGCSRLQRWVRPGICLYGADPQKQKEKRNGMPVLLQVMHWHAPVVGRKRVPKGTPVSYGGNFITKLETELAVLRVGYADGYLRSMSGRASVLISGRRAPVLGTICMDMIVVDVTEHVQLGTAVNLQDRATLLGCDPEHPDASIHLDEMALWRDSIPYEVTCGVSARVPRIHSNR